MDKSKFMDRSIISNLLASAEVFEFNKSINKHAAYLGNTGSMGANKTTRMTWMNQLRSFPDILVASATVDGKTIALHFACASVYSLLGTSSNFKNDLTTSTESMEFYLLHRVIGSFLGPHKKTMGESKYDSQFLLKLNQLSISELLNRYNISTAAGNNINITGVGWNENNNNNWSCLKLLPDSLSGCSNLRQSYAFIPVPVSNTTIRQYYLVQLLITPIDILSQFNTFQKQNCLAKINQLLTPGSKDGIVDIFKCNSYDAEDIMLNNLIKLHCGMWRDEVVNVIVFLVQIYITHYIL